ncbi:MAG: 4Fe-4S binding protein [Candidatus Thermoplasmatota archaeon]|nr:4Fe-4S binding protein [Candidatus Thermoplasmatota archaeon]MCL5963420.1 4Fe-4S binding protein [Candidatus Thermoplasmatota archaeon]
MIFNKGATITSTGNSIANETGSWRSMKPVIDYSKCIRCDICWTYCPDIAIDKVDGTSYSAPYSQLKKKKVPKINYTFCKGCGICVNECVSKAIDMIREEI